MRTYTTVQLARHLGISRDTIYRWMRARKIQGVKVTRVATVMVRLWSEKDARRIKKFMKENYIAGRGRKKAARK